MSTSKRPKLIAIDHDPGSLETIARAAADRYAVLQTTDPARAMAWLGSPADIAIVIAGHTLPHSSGVALLARARTACPTARRILLTSYGDLASIVEGLHSGAIQRILQRPIQMRELLAILHAAPQTVPSTSAGRHVA